MTLRLQTVLWAACFILFFSFQSILLMLTHSAGSDEEMYLLAAYRYVIQGKIDIAIDHPPFVKQLAGIPYLFMDLKFPTDEVNGVLARDEPFNQWMYGARFLYSMGNPAETMVIRSRLMFVPFGFLLGILLFNWARETIGERGALYSLAFFALTPTLIANSMVVMMDFTSTTFWFGNLYFLYRFFREQRSRDLAFAGICLGIAMISKFSPIIMIPIVYLMSFWFAWSQPCSSFGGNSRVPLWALIPLTIMVITHQRSALAFSPFILLWAARFFPRVNFLQNVRLQAALKIAFIVLAITFLVVAISYFQPFYWFHKFRPFKLFFKGIQIFRGHALSGQTTFLFGDTSKTGWWYYYPITLPLQLPIPLLIASIMGIFVLARQKKFNGVDGACLWLVPAAYFFVASFVNKTQTGIRYLLPVFPFLILWAGAGAVWLQSLFIKRAWIFSLVFIGWLAASVLPEFPSYFSYANPLTKLLGGKEYVLGFSSGGLGQDVKRLRNYVRKEGISQVNAMLHWDSFEELKYYGIPNMWGKRARRALEKKLPGVYVVDRVNYIWMIERPELSWLKSRKPDATIGESFLIYRLGKEGSVTNPNRPVSGAGT